MLLILGVFDWYYNDNHRKGILRLLKSDGNKKGLTNFIWLTLLLLKRLFYLINNNSLNFGNGHIESSINVSSLSTW